MTIRTLVLTLLALAGLAAPAAAQTGPCPTSNALSVIAVGSTINLCLIPASDPIGGHNALDVNTGLPVVTRYDIILLNDGDPLTGPSQATINIGKPALNSDGVAWTVLPNAAVPINRRFRATSVAFGQPNATPSGRSALSNPFVVANPTSPTAPVRTAFP